MICYSIPVRSIFEGLGDGIIAAAMSNDARFIVLIGYATPQVHSVCVSVCLSVCVCVCVYLSVCLSHVCVHVSILCACIRTS